MARSRERPVVGGGFILETLLDLLLLSSQLAGLAAHGAQIIGELARVFLAHLIPQLLQLAFSASAGREGLLRLALGGGLRGTLDILAGLIELPAFVGHPRLIFGAIHPLAQLVNVSEHLLLFLLQTLQAAL